MRGIAVIYSFVLEAKLPYCDKIANSVHGLKLNMQYAWQKHYWDIGSLPVFFKGHLYEAPISLKIVN